MNNETNTLHETHQQSAEHFLKLSFYAETQEERDMAWAHYQRHSATAARLFKTIQ